VADLVALHLHFRRNGPERPPPIPQREHLADGLLLGLMRDQLAVVATPEAEGDGAAEEAPARLLVGLGLRHALPDAASPYMSLDEWKSLGATEQAVEDDAIDRAAAEAISAP
jgi:hypothetical protein